MSDMDIIKTGDGSVTLYHNELDETYHSRRGAIEESKYVYIKNGLEKLQNKSHINVLELGFGTGLNILLTCMYAEETHKTISIISLEPFPIQDWSVLNYCSELDFPSDVFDQMHRLEFDTQIQLFEYVTFMKVNKRMEEYSSTQRFDVIYYDAFAPSKQSEVWAFANIKKCFDLLNDEGLLTTYCAQGQFKRDMKAAGFILENPAGPLGKKEMTIGLKTKKG